MSAYYPADYKIELGYSCVDHEFCIPLMLSQNPS